jgi:succinate dehydrogenase/fumarate reductase-like Fe-S protein
MPESVIRAKIYRYDPDQDDGPHYQEYEVPAERSVTVHELLVQIHRDHDGSLAFRTYKCYKGTCATCLVKLDGKVVKGCATQVEPGTNLTLEPPNGGKQIRDLVVDFDTM